MRIRKWVVIALPSALILSIAASVWLQPLSDDQLFERAEASLQKGHYEQCEADCQLLLVDDFNRPSVLLMAGRAAVAQGHYEDALRYWATIPPTAQDQWTTAQRQSARLLLGRGHLRQAELLLRQLLAVNSTDSEAYDEVGKLLVMQGRAWEARHHFLRLVEQGDSSAVTVLLAGNGGHPSLMSEERHRLQSVNPDDPGFLLALAASHYDDGNSDDLIRELRRIVALDPSFVAAQAKLGLLLAKSAPLDQVKDWEQQLPGDADLHPDIWTTRGFCARRVDQNEAAARCFWEGIRRDAQNQLACYQLAQVLSVLGRDDDALRFSSRATQLETLGLALHNLYKNPQNPPEVRRAQSICERLGRYVESAAWCRVALQMQPELTWPRDAMNDLAKRLANRLASASANNLTEENPAIAIDLSGLPLPSWTDAQSSTTSSVASAPAEVRFRDYAADAGLHFQYFNSEDPATPGKRMFEFTGGGAATLDYDLDGWPDIHLTQGTNWPVSDSNDKYLDQLFRNLGDGTFLLVTGHAGTGDAAYSQGCSVGDFNSDGFPDLYLANIGRNCLYRNNGDGTFTDVSHACGLSESVWTTSCVLADLNGDALPDIYDVNYLRGDDVFTRTCEDLGLQRACPPSDFDAEQDALFLNTGDGRFVDATSQAGVMAADGSGLGVVVGDFDGQGLLSAFVANDGRPNFFFRNQTSPGNGIPEFVESAVLAGLAYDYQGKSQACMGVAADDFDGNGLVDLFVTNFYLESNTLYLHRPGGYFIDDTVRSGLRDPSLALLGFGTQSIDGELDGWPDLVVTNGHIEDYSDVGQPYRMPPQYFRNVGHGTFEEVKGEIGPYFQGAYLGRGLARLDWNRDGREDFVVSHLDAPVALVTNETTSTGRFWAVQLRGVQSNRDAIGTTVVVSANNRTWTKQLTAGDGYMASNERRLVFGLGKVDVIDAVKIKWPSGKQQEFTNLPVDTEFLIIEGTNRPVRLSR